METVRAPGKAVTKVPQSADWEETLRETHGRWREYSETDALHGSQLVVQDGGTDVVSEEAEVVRLRRVQMGHDISL